MPWTGNNNWACNQCDYKVHANGSQVSAVPNSRGREKPQDTIRNLRIIIAHLEIHSGDKLKGGYA